MSLMRLGIIREEKIPVDKRVPFTPQQAASISQTFPHVRVVCQSSKVRCFGDDEYDAAGIPVVDDVSDCDILMGIKEVPIESLLSNKTYFFFSHTIKRQAHNRALLRTILAKKIRLIDYEALTDTENNRLVAFGRYAGIVGAYNGLWTYGQRYNAFTLRRAMDCFDLSDLRREFVKVKLPPIRIVLTGSGRVGKGAVEVLTSVGIEQVNVDQFLTGKNDKPVFVQLSSADYHLPQHGGTFDREEFHSNPGTYKSDFMKFATKADMLIAGAFWNPDAPKLFTRDEMLHPDFKIRIIADISCDINGSIPATIQPTNVSNPVFDYDPVTHSARPPFSSENHITVMAVDNLPCELPRDASQDFGQNLLQKIIPRLFADDRDHVIGRATVTANGRLTENFHYLQSFVDGHS